MTNTTTESQTESNAVTENQNNANIENEFENEISMEAANNIHGCLILSTSILAPQDATSKIHDNTKVSVIDGHDDINIYTTAMTTDRQDDVNKVKRRRYGYISIETKERVISALESGNYSRSDVAELFEITYTSVCKIYSDFLLGKPIQNIQRKTFKPKKLNTDQINFIRTELDNNCSLTLNELKSKILETYNITVSLPTISRYIQSFHYSIKRIQVMALPAVTNEIQEQRKMWCNSFLRLYNSQRTIMFFDETGFQVSMRRFYGRSQVGKRAQVVAPSLRTRNKNVMAAMLKDRLFYYKILEGSSNRITIAEYLRELFIKLCTEDINNVAIIMDNASFHRCIEIRDMINKNGHELIFLPPYSPFFNPIEYLFSQWKSLVRTGNPTNEEQLNNLISLADQHITNEHCRSYCQHVINNAISCLAGNNVYDQ